MLMHWTASLQSLYPWGKNHKFSLDRTVEEINVRHRLGSRERNTCLESNTVVRAFGPCNFSLNCLSSLQDMQYVHAFRYRKWGLVRSTADMCFVVVEFKY